MKSTIVLRLLMIAAVMTLTAGVAAAQDAATASEETADLKINLPEPCYMGTPMSYFSDRLEIELTMPPAPKVPQDVALISKGKAVKSPAKPTLGKLEAITDGDKSATEKALVELPSGAQYIDIDLGSDFEIYTIVLWRYHAEERVYFDTVVKTANDADFIDNVQTLYNNDHDNSAAQGAGTDKEFVEKYWGRRIDGKGKTARFVRLYSTGNTSDDMNHYLEVEVYGRPVKK